MDQLTEKAMDRYRRKNSKFSLCGLNCCLCPRYNTEGSSRCPGCGGKDFETKHPACPVITCSKKHDNVEYCFQCSSYPCERYHDIGKKDSFISYRRVRENLQQGQKDINAYLRDLDKRERMLGELIEHFNDGRKKGFFCLAANDLPAGVLENLFETVTGDETLAGMDIKEKAKIVSDLIRKKALEAGIELRLRKGDD